MFCQGIRGRHRYRIIDPKGIIGDPIFETAHFIYEECAQNSLQPEHMEMIFDYFERSLKIPSELLRQCFYIETARYICEEGWDAGIVDFAYEILKKYR